MTRPPSAETKSWPFDAVTKNDWLDAARQEWQGTLPAEKIAALTAKSATASYYDQTDLPARLSPRLQTGSREARSWHNMPLISVSTDKEANATARNWLNAGADGIVFDLVHDSKPEQLLDAIELPFCAVSYLAGPEHLSFFEKLHSFATAKNYNPEAIEGAVFWKSSPTPRHELATRFQTWSRFYTNGVQLADSAESVEEEISSLLVKAVMQMRVLAPQNEADTRSALQSIAFLVPTGLDFFQEVVKLKCIRMLWRLIATSFVSGYDAPVFMHAIWNSKPPAECDPHGQLLACTTAAMSAVVGGSDAITLCPTVPTDLAMQRILRNISSILREESHLSKVADPTAGAYFLEHEADRIARVAWQQFQLRLP